MRYDAGDGTVQPVRAFLYTTRGLFPATIQILQERKLADKEHECVDRRYYFAVGELNYAAGGSVYGQTLHRGF